MNLFQQPMVFFVNIDFTFFSPLKGVAKYFDAQYLVRKSLSCMARLKSHFGNEKLVMNSYIYIYMDHVYRGRFGNVWPTPSWLNSLGLYHKIHSGNWLANVCLRTSKQVNLAYLVVGIPNLILCTSLILLTVLSSIGHVPLSC